MTMFAWSMWGMMVCCDEWIWVVVSAGIEVKGEDESDGSDLESG
jgi:hypothetical protein